MTAPFPVRLTLVSAVLAFGLAAYTSTQGLHKDQLIFFHGALRVASGQIPYVHFSLPQGPAAPLVGGLFFYLLPAGWAWVTLSGLLNAVTAILAARLVFNITSDPIATAFAAALTAISFLPPFGSFYNDHLAYTLVLAAFCCALEKRAIAAGLLLALSLHTKQTVGGLGIIVTLLALVAGGREYLQTAVRTIATSAIVFVAGLVLIAAAGGGVRYVWDAVWLPFTFSQHSNDKGLGRLVEFLVFPYGIWPGDLAADFPRQWGRWVLIPYQLAHYAGAWLLWKSWPGPDRRLRMAVLFCWLSPVWCGALLGRASSHLFLGTGALLGLLLADARTGTYASPSFRRFTGYAALAFLTLGTAQTTQSIWIRGVGRTASRPETYPIALPLSDAPVAAAAAKVRSLGSAGLFALGEKALLACALAAKTPVQRNLYDDMAVSVPSTYAGLLRWQTEFREHAEATQVPWILRDSGWTVAPATGPVLGPYLRRQYDPVWSSGSLTLYRRLTLTQRGTRHADFKFGRMRHPGLN